MAETEAVADAIPFLALVAALSHGVVSAGFAMFPFSLDRVQKRTLTRRIAALNVLLAVVAVAAVSAVMIIEAAPVEPDTLLRSYAYAAVGVVVAHGLLLQAPGAYVASAIDRGTVSALRELSAPVVDAVYGSPDSTLTALDAFRAQLATHRDVLSDYGLLPLAERFAAPADTPRGEVGIRLLNAMESMAAALPSGTSPFRELNFVVSLSGASLVFALLTASIK